MSFARDDISLSENLLKLNTVVFQARIAKKELKTNSDSSSRKRDESEKIDLSENISKRLVEVKKAIESTQEGKNLLETAEQGLSSISSNLKDVKKLLSKGLGSTVSDEDWKEIGSAVDEHFKEIDKIAKETSFNDVKPLDGSSYKKVTIDTEINGKIDISSKFGDTSIKSLNLPDKFSLKGPEGIGSFLDSVNNAIKQVQGRHDGITETRENIEKTLDNLSTINSSLSVVDSNSKDKDVPTQLKEAAMNGLLSNPEASMKIFNLDGDTILALLKAHQ